MGASAPAQVRALLVKSAVYQRRNTATNICLVVAPVFFCGLLALLQVLANKLLLTQRINQCGCQCISCCVPYLIQRSWTDEELRRIENGEKVTPRYIRKERCSFMDTGYCERTRNATCRTFNDSNCGLRFSSPRQAVFCAIPETSSWPPVMQTPRLNVRAGGATSQWLPYTGTNLTAAAAVAANLVTEPQLPNLQGLIELVLDEPASLLSLTPRQVLALVLPMLAPGGLLRPSGDAVDAAQLSRLELKFGSSLTSNTDYYLENAFINSNSNFSRIQFLLPTGRCAATGISNETSNTALPLAEMLLRYYNASFPLLIPPLLSTFNVTPGQIVASLESSPFSGITAACVDTLPRQLENVTALNRRLYCGFGKARCDGTYFTREYGAAWNFKELGPTVLKYDAYYNLSLPEPDMPVNYRIAELLNMATKAWTKTYWDDLSIVYTARNRLMGLMSFPKQEWKLKLDFSVLLGPLFYTWVVQMLMPSFLHQLVYEKEKRLRMMMKMHGLGDGAYWLVTYLWYLMLYIAYMVFFVFFGMLIRLKMFTTSSLSLQAVLYFIFGNNMLAFILMLSSLFSSSRTATVASFLYIFATGLIGELLLRTLMQQNKSYIIAVQLVPGFALYRGLFEFAEYSQRALFGNGPGLHWANLRDPDNGMIGVWIILLLEWPLFIALGWYFEQVLNSGTGASQHPLFFLWWLWRKPDAHLKELRAAAAGAPYGMAAARAVKENAGVVAVVEAPLEGTTTTTTTINETPFEIESPRQKIVEVTSADSGGEFVASASSPDGGGSCDAGVVSKVRFSPHLHGAVDAVAAAVAEGIEDVKDSRGATGNGGLGSLPDSGSRSGGGGEADGGNNGETPGPAEDNQDGCCTESDVGSALPGRPMECRANGSCRKGRSVGRSHSSSSGGGVDQDADGGCSRSVKAATAAAAAGTGTATAGIVPATIINDTTDRSLPCNVSLMRLGSNRSLSSRGGSAGGGSFGAGAGRCDKSLALAAAAVTAAAATLPSSPAASSRLSGSPHSRSASVQRDMQPPAASIAWAAMRPPSSLLRTNTNTKPPDVSDLPGDGGSPLAMSPAPDALIGITQHRAGSSRLGLSPSPSPPSGNENVNTGCKAGDGDISTSQPAVAVLAGDKDGEGSSSSSAGRLPPVAPPVGNATASRGSLGTMLVPLTPSSGNHNNNINSNNNNQNQELGVGGQLVQGYDVLAEVERVAAMDDQQLISTPIVVRNLSKVFAKDRAVKGLGKGGAGGGYGCGGSGWLHCCCWWCKPKRPVRAAVRTLTLAIERGECFGLLGPNGAGKTTTINMLTGFLESSGGDALVEGRSVRTRMPEIYRMMGVCPQDNLLWDQLTGEEHLKFYGRLKGLKGKELTDAVDAGLKSVKLHLNGAGKRRVTAYSGGMKRRLSVAISFIGSPQVVYLDEPSTGLDPASRRALWDVIRNHKEGRAIILTTHSMEEAEILCDRLGIFVDGQLVCIGNPREITSRYAGYLVFTITVGHGHEEAAKAFVAHMSPNSRLTYALGGTFKYELPTDDVSLSAVFRAVATAKAEMQVLDWGVANATLEEVFIKFARQLGVETQGRLA